MVTFKPGKEMEERVRQLSDAASARAALLDDGSPEDEKLAGRSESRMPGRRGAARRRTAGSEPRYRSPAGAESARP